MKGKPKLVPITGGYTVMIGKRKVDSILASKEVSRRHSFRVDGDPESRLCRGKDMTVSDLLQHHEIMKRAKNKSEAIFMTWSQNPNVSNQLHRLLAQALMRHSDLTLTMQTYTAARLLDSAGAVERLPDLPLDGARSVAQYAAHPLGNRGKSESIPDHLGTQLDPNEKAASPYETRGNAALSEVDRRRLELPTSALRTCRR